VRLGIATSLENEGISEGGKAARGSPPNAPKCLSKLILDSYLSKGRGTASFERFRNQGF
jgi:hypothetical protein